MLDDAFKIFGSFKAERLWSLLRRVFVRRPAGENSIWLSTLEDYVESKSNGSKSRLSAYGARQLQLIRQFQKAGEPSNALRIARELFSQVDDPLAIEAAATSALLVQHLETPARLLPVVEKILDRIPVTLQFALLHSRLLRQTRAPRPIQFRSLKQVLKLSPDDIGILGSLVKCSIANPRIPELEAEAEGFAKQLVELEPNSENFFTCGRLLLLRGKQAEALAMFEKIGPRLEPDKLGILRDALNELCDLFNQNYYNEAGTNLEALRKSLAHSHQYLSVFLRRQKTLSATDLEVAVHALMPLNRLFAELSRQAKVDDAIGSHFGTIDLEPFSLLADALLNHITLILEHALSEQVLSQTSEAKSAVHRLVDTYTSLLLVSGQAARALDRLELLAATSHARQVAGLLRELRAINDFEASQEFVRECSVEDSQSIGNLHRAALWDEWISTQALAVRALTETPGRETSYSVAMPNGEVRQGTYRQQPFRLEAVTTGPIRLRASELLISPNGLLLKSHPIHGRYPPGSPILLKGTPQTIRLRPPLSSERVEEPVIILAGNYCARLPSYGHWIIFTLSRLNAIVDCGLTELRKLLMPAEAKPWMKSMMAMVGLPDERIIFYTKDKELIVEDAEIVSTADHSASELLGKLRAKMRLAVGVADGNRGATPFLFLARKAQLNRMLLDEDKVYGIAERLGYAIISPETLSIANQVRLFSQAAAVAGPGGSAFANIIYCDSGARTVCIKAEEKVSPLVLDLAVANNLEFRWLLGQSIPSLTRYMHPLDVPFRVDMDVLERQLAWAMEAPGHR